MMHKQDAGDKSARPTLGGLELRCPPLPQTLIEALELIDKPENMEVGPVTEMVQRDPIVVARLLHIVNSAYYGLRHTISSADRAVVMLGPVAVAGIVLGMHMLQLRSILEGPASACFQKLIRHSIATAFLTRHLVEGTPRDAQKRLSAARIGVSFTSGLLHDFGKIILIYNFQEKALKLYGGSHLQGQIAVRDELEIERLLFGYDHTEAGEFAARKLTFPETLVNVIRHHHAHTVATGDPEVDWLIRAAGGANAAAKVMGYSLTDREGAAPLALDPAWERMLSQDADRFQAPDELLDDLLGQKDHLDVYVSELTTSVAKPIDERELRRKKRIWRLHG